ncbi:hypothetical protein BH23ACT11_BH23ACT11_01670 [soil metagenome]
MQDTGLLLAAIMVMVVLNVLMVVATIAVKALRSFEKRRVQRLKDELEPALYDYLANGEISPALEKLPGKDPNILSNLMIKLLLVLRGAENNRVVELAHKLGLVERDHAKLSTRHRWQRAKAAENLGYYGGPDAVAPISALLDQQDETLRAVAARALARIGTKQAAETLAEHLRSRSELTSLRMAENLERIGPLAVDPLVELVESDDEELHRAQVLAARVLGNLRISDGRPALCKAIQRHRNPDLRAQATLALGKVGNPDDVPTLVEAAGDDFWPVRVQAANALGMLGEVSTVPKLKELVSDREWWVRLNASKALVKIGPEGEKALADLLEGPDRFARDRAAATLEEQGIVRRLAIELAQENGRSESAERVIRSLVEAGATRHLDRLCQTLPEESVRRALSRVLSETRAEIHDA